MATSSSPTKTHQARADRLLLVLSDLEMGTGGHMDDFPQSEYIGELLAQYDAPMYANQQIELIFNGDTFDFLKIDVDEAYPHHLTAEMAHQKLDKVIAAHSGFFQGLKRFLSGHPERKIHFLVGNHDLELLFPTIKEAIIGLIGSPKQVHCHDDQLHIGDVHIEHGHQRVGMFRVNLEAPFLQHKGRRILRLPWGNVALLKALVPLKSMLYLFDRIKPKSRLFEHIPSLQRYLNQVYWQYWTRDFWRGKDPLRKLTWSMVKDIVHAIFFVGPDTILSPMACRTAMLNSTDCRLFLAGHEHEAGWWSRCGQKLMYTGCFRNEYLLSHEPEPNLQLQSKVFAEVWMQGSQSIRSHLIEVDGPAPPQGYQPTSLKELPMDFLAKEPLIPHHSAASDQRLK